MRVSEISLDSLADLMESAPSYSVSDKAGLHVINIIAADGRKFLVVQGTGSTALFLEDA